MTFQRMSSLSGFTHSRHSSVNPGDKSIVWSPASRCTTPVIAFFLEIPVSVIKLVLRGEAIRPTPNPNVEDQDFSVGCVLPLVSGSGYLKAPNTRLPPLSLGCQLLLALPGATDDEDVRHITSLAEPV